MARDEPDEPEAITYPKQAEDYIYVERTGHSASGITEICEVRSKSRHGLVLGEIKWKASWRKYAFYPAPDTLFDPGCMYFIARHVAGMTKRHYAQGGTNG